MISNNGEEYLRPRYHHLIGGEYRPPANDSYFKSYNPATETELTEIAEGTAADVDAAVVAAQSSLQS